MYQQQSLQKAELSDGKIGCVDSLSALATRNPNSNLRLLNHGHIIGTVADGQRHGLRRDAFSHQTHHLCLLRRAHPARDEHGAALGDVQQLLLGLITLHEDLQCLPRDHQSLPAGVVKVPISLELVEVHRALLLVYDAQVHGGSQHLGAEADVPRRLQLVTSEDPELDASSADLLDGLGDAFLELVLDCGCAQDVQTHFDVFGDIRQFLLSIFGFTHGHVVACLPILYLWQAQPSVADDECSKALDRELFQILLKLWVLVRSPVQHDIVSSLDEQEEFFPFLNNHRHPLARGVELVGGEHRVSQLPGGRSWRGHVNAHIPAAAAPEGPPLFSSGGHEGELVGALGLVLRPSILARGNHHGVGHRQHLKEGVHRRPVHASTCRLQLVAAVEAILAALLKGAIFDICDCDALQLHVVLRERACLVREDVANLAQLLTQVRRARNCRVTHAVVEELLLVIHMLVVANEVALEGIAELDGRVQRDRHKVGVQCEKGQPPAKHLRQDDIGREQVPMFFQQWGELTMKDRTREGEDGLHGQDDQHRRIRDDLKVRLLQMRRSRVADHPGISAGVADDADAEGSIPQHRPSH
mmetsp:Transcript_17808/g.62498  ORF Transcript_17808/g.62498 Transcript_17808/m.62498 type:complete len:585 (+) Transcript_17808:2623-4377(+)